MGLVLLLQACRSLPSPPPSPPVILRLVFDQEAASLAEAQAYFYTLYTDDALGERLAGVLCRGTTSPYPCEVTPPRPWSQGQRLTLTASNAAGESPRSVEVVVPVP
jgi:hypothetical protein